MSSRLPRLFLARHGDTDWTDSRRKTGRTDLPLNERGEQRARQLGERLQQFSFAQVFTSPLQRASRTCALAGFGDVAETDSDLVEWDYGRFEGKTDRRNPEGSARTGNCFATAVLAANRRRMSLSARTASSRECSAPMETSWRFPAATSSA